jgi:hypothetical protein
VNINPNPATSSSHRAKVLSYLSAGETLTQAQAVKIFGCARLAARIEELRTSGHQISSTMITVRNRDGKAVRVAQYKLNGAD